MKNYGLVTYDYNKYSKTVSALKCHKNTYVYFYYNFFLLEIMLFLFKHIDIWTRLLIYNAITV